MLRAEGYSYKQIQEITGWTYTKVNRCLTEGRKAFLERVAGIEAGSECERLAPLLSKLVDGEATADDLTTLRPHIRTCLACRAALREYRSAPATAAALVPAAAFARRAARPFLDAPARLLEGILAWTQKAQTAVEMASAQKVAAVAASTAVLGGGAAVTVHAGRASPRAREADCARRSASGRKPPAPRPRLAGPPSASPVPVLASTPQPSTRPKRREREAKRKTPPAQQEFEPAWAAGEPAPTTSTATASTAGAPAPARESSASGGGEEFAP